MVNASIDSRKWIVFALAMFGMLLLQAASLSLAAPSGQSESDGRAVFEQYCTGCHTIGGGDLAGPDLQGVAETRDPAWLRRWLEEPDKMLAEGDPIATELLEQYNGIPMPNQNLSSTEIDALLIFMGAPEQTQAPPPTTQDAGPTGNAEQGNDLFTGSKRLENGGTACVACHDVAGLGLPGGGLLGPDLTNSAARYGGEAGMQAVLASVPFPSMVPVYQDRPLTPAEQANLSAFLQNASENDTPNRTMRRVTLLLLAFGAMDVFLGLLFVWHRRLPQHTRRSLKRR